MKLKKITEKKIPWKNVLLKTNKKIQIIIMHSVSIYYSLDILMTQNDYIIDTLGISHQIHGYR